jgi:flagellar assembly factor FliW
MESMDQYLMNIENLRFPEGLQGIPEWKNFRLQQTKTMLPIALLQSKDENLVSLIVANPFSWFPAYRLDITDEEMASLKASKVDDLYILAIINVESEPFQVTANLLSPLVINPQSGLGMQKLLPQSGYKARHPLSLRTLKVNVPEGLLGIPEYKDFILQSADELAPVYLFTCQKAKTLSFPMLEPQLLDPKYAPEVSDEDMEALGSPEMTDLMMFVILNVQNEPFSATANLKAPLIINTRSGIGRQVLLTKSGYQASQPVNLGRPVIPG